MAKYRELPAKPRNVHAIQYTGMENGVPTWNEPAPAWILAAFAKGRLAVVDGVLYCQRVNVAHGSWLVVDADMNVDGLSDKSATEFLSSYTIARKKAVRKPKHARLVA